MKLKITNNTLNKNIDQINIGELFIVSDNEKDEYKLFKGVFMKVEKSYNDIKVNAVKLNDGTLYNINSNLLLQIIDGELII